MARDWAAQMHGFYVDLEEKEMPFDIKSNEGLRIIYDEVKGSHPEHVIRVAADVDWDFSGFQAVVGKSGP
ncbi:MAG: hypothetical protein Q4B54_05575 [Coriobacteriales bacterium]|nr:hypothetical protein [Coriobacteriales bacterium]